MNKHPEHDDRRAHKRPTDEATPPISSDRRSRSDQPDAAPAAQPERFAEQAPLGGERADNGND